MIKAIEHVHTNDPTVAQIIAAHNAAAFASTVAAPSGATFELADYLERFREAYAGIAAATGIGRLMEPVEPVEPPAAGPPVGYARPNFGR